MAAIFEWIFWNENAWISINISLKFVPRSPINNIPTLLQVMAWGRPGDKPLSESMMVKLRTHICVTRPQWVKNWLCYSGHRVALVVHRAQKSVPDSAGEWPTFLPPPLESSSGTANADGPNCIAFVIHKNLYLEVNFVYFWSLEAEIRKFHFWLVSPDFHEGQLFDTNLIISKKPFHIWTWCECR